MWVETFVFVVSVDSDVEKTFKIINNWNDLSNTTSKATTCMQLYITNSESIAALEKRSMSFCTHHLYCSYNIDTCMVYLLADCFAGGGLVGQKSR